ncbi:MAG: triose-phosphate isomerase [Alphaproteobacteria bacterium]
MAPRRPLIAGNWKMIASSRHGLALAAELAARAKAAGAMKCDMLLCPPATLIRQVSEAVAGSGLAVGGQDCHAAPGGAHTGDVSAVLLAEAGCSFVIVGHSERRRDHGETSEMVRDKAAAAHAAGLTPIICVGESEAERDAGETLAVVRSQLEGSLPADAAGADTVIAYEPVWAIGTARTPTGAEIAEVHGHIRHRLAAVIGEEAQRTRILYGGSVTSENASEILTTAEVDGALVGTASLEADAFWRISESCP